jgi:hypothetical protein
MSALLAAMLEAMGDLELFNRSDGVDPCLLLDGHGSCFELPFIENIHREQKWTVIIGVPYGTSLWQAGDSKQHNGQYKDMSKDAKEKLLNMKTKQWIKFVIGWPDIMWIVRYALDTSFVNIETNKHTIAKRGWGGGA